jgi:hypothetical protein
MSNHAIAFQMVLQRQQQQQQQQAMAQAAGAPAGYPVPPPPAMSTQRKPVAGWRCEPCDKDFSGETQLNAHLESHIGCDHPDCSFEASKKVVSAHFHSTHGLYSGSGYKSISVEGQQFRVLLGTSHSEVEQWRADRRKNWPSSANMRRKREESHSAQKGHTDRSSKRKREELSMDEPSGLASIMASYADSSDDGENVEGNATEGHEATETRPESIGKQEDGAPQQHHRKPCKWHARGKCTKGAACRFSHEGRQHKAAKHHQKSPFVSPRPQALLSALLKKEVQEETSIILQCIRFLVRECL